MRGGVSFWRRGMLVACVWLGAALGHAGVNYYVDPGLGDDANSGTSPKAAFRTLARAETLLLQAGDHLLLAAGQTFAGQLRLKGLSGSDTQPIVISSYPAADKGSDAMARIDAKGHAAGVLLKNCSHVTLANLGITGNGGGMDPAAPSGKAAMRCGVLVQADRPGVYGGFTLSNLVVENVFFEEPGFRRNPEEVRSANGTQNYGWGIRFISSSPAAVMQDITIHDCRIANVSHTGLKLTAPGNGLRNVTVQGLRIANTGGPGVQMSGVSGGHFSQLEVNHSGSTNDTRNWGRGSGLWTWGSSDVVIEKSRFLNANGPGDSAGVHIDFNCRNVIVQYNLSAHNAGGFCEILGNNYNCAYRYNVSVNDGYRIKGQGGAFQEGKTFWLSGYTGDKSPRQGPFNTYFYNNTIYVSPDIVAKIAVTPTARGVLIANNIFYFAGSSVLVPGDQNRPDASRPDSIPEVVFENNLFLRPDTWPAVAPVQDNSPILGDPEFKNGGGLTLDDYVPANVNLIRDRGIAIPRIPNDQIGLAGGMNPGQDILGHAIQGQPDVGAIELP